MAHQWYEQLVFQGKRLDPDHDFSFSQPYEELWWQVEDDVKLHGLHFQPVGQSKGTVLYFHGNADNLDRWGQYAADFTRLGYEVIMPDFRGYGKSEGYPTEQALYADARTVWDHIGQACDRPTILYGRSLGSAVASRLAGQVPCDLLVLETPFDEFSSAAFSLFKPAFSLLEQSPVFSNQDHLSLVSARTAIFHGTRDWVVPLRSAKRLQRFTAPEDFVIIDRGGHRNLNQFAVYHDKLRGLLSP